MSKVSTNELAKAISAKHGLSQVDAEAFITNLFNVINSGLNFDKIVKVKGLGTFKVIDVRDRESVNVNTGERVVIEGHGKVSFTPDTVMRDLVNKPFAKFETVVLNEGVNLDELSEIDTAEIEGSIDEKGETRSLDEIAPVDNVVSTLESEEKEPVEPLKPDDPLIDDTIVENEEKDIESVSSIFNTPKESQTLEESQQIAVTEEDSINNDTPKEVCIPIESTISETNESDSICSEPEAEKVGFFGRNKKLLLIFGVALICIMSFAIGYFWGQSMASRPVFKTVKVYNITKQKHTTAPIKTNSVSKQEASKLESDTLKAKTSVASPKKENATEPSLDNATRQVKTGAYTITGTSTTTTVKKGQTLKQLSKFYLGDGMECYIQVHNNIVDVKEGMTLKIPALKVKKR